MFKEVIELEVDIEDKGKRLDAYLTENLEDLTRSYIKTLIDDNFIEIKGQNKVKSGIKLKGNETIIAKIPEDQELDVEAENIPIDIVFEDEHIAIINKQPNLVVHPAPGNYNGTLVNAIMYHIKDLSTINGVIRPGIVHRLDKDTSGLIIIAKNDNAHVKLTEMFRDKRNIKKTYLCIVKGNLIEESGRIENLIGRNPNDRKKMAVVSRNGKTAISNYTVLDMNNNHSLVMVNIETGRTHQIRVHMKYIKHPILGDMTYGSTGKVKANRQMLHAYRLEFTHPVTGKSLNIIGKLPEDFVNMMNKLDLKLEK